MRHGRVKVNISVSLQVQLVPARGCLMQWAQLHLKYPACQNALHYAPSLVRQLVLMLCGCIPGAAASQDSVR